MTRIVSGSAYQYSRNTNRLSIPSGSLSAGVNGVLGDTAVGKRPQCVARAKAAYRQPEPLGHGVAT